ncbi:hypothetical protein DICVIV_00710 [Dictyocaulus viviparus]|uniref:snRNA-activating protein complex subunit 1 n=1 Tax=Dictyocaulus viviparus TaxID=29172 RepID=A0A0D8Y8G4_DICVI|nr:hypothetical protein DICVIV_00710 [Dictyocaulus viviparus]
MKGGGLSRPPVDAGLSDDMKTLLQAFLEKKSYRLVDFYDVVIDYGVKDIYCDRMSVAELIEFEQCLLDAAFTYVRSRKEYENGFGEERSVEERIFGIYAIFVLYYAQPIDYVSKIRICPSDIADLKQFVAHTIMPRRYMEAYGCLYKLFRDGAFMVTALRKKYDLSHHHTYDKPNSVEVFVDEKERYVPLQAVKEIMEHPVLKSMEIVQKEIERKQVLISKDLDLVETSNNLFSKMRNTYSLLKYEFFKIDHELDVDDDFSDIEDGEDSQTTSRPSKRARCSAVQHKNKTKNK